MYTQSEMKHTWFLFAYIILQISASRLGVLPLELNKLLIIVVVLSMALTPFLNEAGRRAAKFIENNFDADDVRSPLRFYVIKGI